MKPVSEPRYLISDIYSAYFYIFVKGTYKILFLLLALIPHVRFNLPNIKESSEVKVEELP